MGKNSSGWKDKGPRLFVPADVARHEATRMFRYLDAAKIALSVPDTEWVEISTVGPYTVNFRVKVRGHSPTRKLETLALVTQRLNECRPVNLRLSVEEF